MNIKMFHTTDERAKIINKNHIVSTAITQYTVDGKEMERTKTFVYSKPKKAVTSKTDRIVFWAISRVGFDWSDVYNYLDENLAVPIDEKLEKAILRHTI